MGENLAYALTQVVHNFGAAAVAGVPLFALWPRFRFEDARVFCALVLAGWLAQIGSGATFGVISLYQYGQLPDLSVVATTALSVKIAAALGGTVLAGVYLILGRQWKRPAVHRTFVTLSVLGVAALTAAAFLRWFS